MCSKWLLPVVLTVRASAGRPRGVGQPVELCVADGGPELLARLRDGEVHIGEIGLFPWVAAAAEVGQQGPPGGRCDGPKTHRNPNPTTNSVATASCQAHQLPVAACLTRDVRGSGGAGW